MPIQISSYSKMVKDLEKRTTETNKPGDDVTHLDISKNLINTHHKDHENVDDYKNKEILEQLFEQKPETASAVVVKREVELGYLRNALKHMDEGLKKTNTSKLHTMDYESHEVLFAKLYNRSKEEDKKLPEDKVKDVGEHIFQIHKSAPKTIPVLKFAYFLKKEDISEKPFNEMKEYCRKYLKGYSETEFNNKEDKIKYEGIKLYGTDHYGGFPAVLALALGAVENSEKNKEKIQDIAKMFASSDKCKVDVKDIDDLYQEVNQYMNDLEFKDKDTHLKKDSKIENYLF